MYTTLIWNVFACSGPEEPPPEPSEQPPLAAEVLASLSMERVRDDVDLLASDDRGGRAPGTPGHDFARDFLAAEMAAAGLEPVGDGFVVEHELHLSRTRWGLDEQGEVFETPADLTGYNLLGIRPGTDSDEVVLFVAHYDHLGVTESGEVNNGAFDNAAAVAAMLELMRVLDEHDVYLPRGLGFLFTDSEETGLSGATAWVAEPSMPLTDVVAALSIDPMGRPLLPDRMPLIALGAERSPEILAAMDAIAPFVETPMNRGNRTPLVSFGSDQDAFWEAPSPVPALWITSGGMSFYHTVDDDPDTIDYRSVATHLPTIAQLGAQLASSDGRPTDRGPQDLSVDDLEQAVALLDDVMTSTELSGEELAVAQDYRDLFQAGVQAGSADAPQYPAGYAEMLLYVIAELAPAHPGPIPPPFPD